MTPIFTRKKPYGTIQINIGTITGRVFSMDVFPTETVLQIKERISYAEGIAVETQQLVYCGKHLKNDCQVIKEIGIQDGSNLSLVIQMNGGPGPPIVPSFQSEEDQVVFLLCKQNQELFVLEVHLKDGQKPQTVTKHLLRVHSPSQGNSLLERLESNECFDISEMCEFQMNANRPSSGASAVSSLVESTEPIGQNTPHYEGNDDPFIDNLLWESELLLSEANSNTSLKRRPATSISLMRIPNGGKPMIIIPKTRPATAEKILEGVQNQLATLELGLEQKPIHLKEAEPILTNPFTAEKSPEFDLEWETIADKNVPPRTRVSRTPKRTLLKPKDSIISSNETSSDTLLQFNSKSSVSSRRQTPRKTSAKRRTPGKPTLSKRSNCSQCNKKLGPAQIFTCKCKKVFCGSHRYSDRHSCTFDYKTVGKADLEKSNPLVKKDKCIKL
jgi:hypothetical protein